MLRLFRSSRVAHTEMASPSIPFRTGRLIPRLLGVLWADGPQPSAFSGNGRQLKRSAVLTGSLRPMIRQTLSGYKSLHPLTPNLGPPQLQQSPLWDGLWPFLCYNLISPFVQSCCLPFFHNHKGRALVSIVFVSV